MERLKKIGAVAKVHSSAVDKSTLGIGFEKLDRGLFDPEKAYDKVAYQSFTKPNGSSAFVYWKPENLLKHTLESTITVECAEISGTPRLVDLLDGSIYEIPESILKHNKNNFMTFQNLPLRDYPLLLTFGDFI